VHADGAFIEVVGQDPLRLLHTLTAWALRRGTGLPGLAVERRSWRRRTSGCWARR
jgi:hypothetical protein